MPPDSPENSPRRGKLLVIAMLLLGATAGIVALSYWIGVDRRSFPQTQPAAGEGAGAAPWDPVKAAQELDRVATRLNQMNDPARDLPGVLEEARRLVERYPKFAEGRFLYAQALLTAQKEREAYEQVKRSLELNRQQPAAQYFAGVLATRLDFPGEAAQHLSHAVSLDPRNVSYRVSLAGAYRKQQDYDRARATLLEAINLDSSSHEAYFVLSDVYFQQRKLDLAIDVIDKAIAQVPISERAKHVMYTRRQALIYRSAGRAEDSLRVLRALKQKEREDPAVMSDLATTYGQLAEPAEAAKLYEAAMKREPTNREYADAATQWRIRAGDEAAARANLERLRQLNPRHPRVGELEKELEKLKG